MLSVCCLYVARTSALLTRPSVFQYWYPLWNASPKKEGVSPISSLKLVVMATSLDRYGNQYQIEHLHEHVYHLGKFGEDRSCSFRDLCSKRSLKKKERKKEKETRNVGQYPAWWPPCRIYVAPSVQRRKVWLTPLRESRAVTLPRRETRWNLQGCLKLANRSQPLVHRSSPYYQDMRRKYCCLTSFFSDCRHMP